MMHQGKRVVSDCFWVSHQARNRQLEKQLPQLQKICNEEANELAAQRVQSSVDHRSHGRRQCNECSVQGVLGAITQRGDANKKCHMGVSRRVHPVRAEMGQPGINSHALPGDANKRS